MWILNDNETMLDLYVNRKTNAFYSLMLLDINVH